MKKIFTLLCIALSFSTVYAQNVGIGNTSPGTKLDVSGAITHRETSVAVSGNAATIPSNVSQVQLTGSATATISLTAPAAPPNAGQVLVIYNNTTGGFSASYGSTTIPNGVALEFIYSNSAWVATSGAASGSGSYVQNRTTQQPSSDFNVSNTGTVGTTFTAGTSVTSPTVQGSTAPSGTLTLKSTSSGTKPTAGILMNDNIASTSTTTGTAVVTGGEGISGNLNVGGNTAISGSATVTGAVRLSSYPSGLIAADGSGNLTTPRTLTGTSGQLDVTNGNGVSGNPTVNINSSYTAALKSPPNLTGGGNISFIGGKFSWSSRFIIISNGNGSQFSTNGYFDINMPTSGTITGVGGAGSVSATASGIPLTSWQALYYILPIGSSSASVAANFRVAQYTSALVVPETWVLLAVVNGDDGTVRAGNGALLQPGQIWTSGVGMAQNSGNGNYIQNGTSVQAADFNINGNGTIGSTVKFGSYANGLLAGDATGTLTSPRSIAVSGTGIAVTNGNAVSGNPTLNLNYGNSPASASGGGGFPVGNFGQFEAHGTYTDFNTTPNYWGWNYVQGATNAPNSTSSQWYREITSLGSNYPGRGAGSYSLELAYPRFSQAAAGMWMRINEGGSYSSWVRMDAGGAGAASSMHPSMDDISGWTTIFSSCQDDQVGTVNWGFPMVIDGISITSGWISSNGVLGFGSSSSTSFSNTALPASISNDPMLFFHWDDNAADLVRYVVQGTSPNRTCFIQWQGSESLSCTSGSSRVMAYITLCEGSNMVSVRYLNQGSNGDAQGAGATFGFQYAGGSAARCVPMGFNSKMLDDNASNQSFSIDLQ